MKSRSFRNVLLRTSVLAGVALGTASGVAIAQESDDDSREVIVVTGSLFQESANLVETSPVTVIGSEDFAERGVLRAEDMINSLPQAFAAQGSNLANGSSGTASVNLRGLGASRTLVLLNGRRLPYGSINIAAPDINQIPAALVERVDVLTGGASATYGSDAVSGVVNFVLDTDFEGVRFDANWSFYQHENGDGELVPLLQEFAALNPNQFNVPSGSETDGESVDFTAIFGGQLGGGNGHITGYATYQNSKKILQGNRDYGQCALGTRNGGTEFSCSGSSTNEVANLLDVSGGGLLADGTWARVSPTGGEIIARDFTTDTFNFNPFNHYMRPNERYSFGTFANYDFNEWVEGYAEFMFMDNRTNSQIAPSGVFGYGIAGANGGVNCDNPFLSAQQLAYLCTANGASGTDTVGTNGLLILRRNVEGGARNQDIRHTTYRGVLGIRGDLGNSPFTYDLSMAYANTHRSDVYNNDLSIRKLSAALYAVTDPNTGLPVCNINVDADPTNDDPACAPYDIWSSAGPSQAAVAYMANPLHRDGETTQTVITGQIAGDLADYGMMSPMAEEGVKVALGLEYRRDWLNSRPDANYQSGDGAGQGGATLPITGSQSTIDVFTEINVPLIQGRPGIETLGFDVAYRRSDYDTTEADAYKFGLEYAPTEDVRFRGSYQKAVRAANIFELFQSNNIGLFDLTAGANGLFDPCAGDFNAASADPEPAATAAQCANTGVTAAQYGNIADNPAGQFNQLTGGNLALEPEEADTYTLGFVATPTFAPGLTVSVDYFDIEVDKYINTVPSDLALNQCLQTGDAFFCSLINRGNGGTLWANNTGFITATNINTGAISTTGYDVLVNYGFDIGTAGSLELDYVGTIVDSLEVKPLPSSTGADIFDCAGSYGGRCQTNFGSGSNPEYRHKASATWDFANFPVSVTGTWRYFDEVTLDGSTDPTNINYSLAEQNYLDLSARWDATDMITLRAGVNNVMDEDPPLSSVVGTAPGNGNTYPQVYDAFGRYFFFGATVDF